MTSILTSILIDSDVNGVWLEIDPDIQDQAWEDSAAFACKNSRQLAYINLLSQQLILPYVQEEVSTACIEDHQDFFWKLGINGTVIQLGHQRLILIPSENIDTEELRIPQEWVDIPDFVADYYLGVQVDTEENWLRIWGYTTHAKLKEKASYTSRNRSYFLDEEDITEDVESLWLIREFCPDKPTRSPVEPLPDLSQDRLDELPAILANPELVFPRRAVSFAEWAVILTRDYQKTLAADHSAAILQPLDLTESGSRPGTKGKKRAEIIKLLNDLYNLPAYKRPEELTKYLKKEATGEMSENNLHAVSRKGRQKSVSDGEYDWHKLAMGFLVELEQEGLDTGIPRIAAKIEQWLDSMR